jgi:2-keto-4-pentenoate hydratase/2-oxohepta-3-ene-1,7-dioic acid hydratase in catechol pathway
MNTIKIDDQTITPSKIICIGRNYVDHIQELGNEIPDEMIVFFKPNSAISTQLNSQHLQEPLHYEGELCFIYQQGKFSAVGFGLDLTKRGLQNKLKVKGLPWERAKAFNGSALFSDFVSIKTIDDELSLELQINGTVKQEGDISLMMYKPDIILEELQKFVALEDGDIVMTGTPKGVGEIPTNAKFVGRVLQKGKTLITKSWHTR